MLKNEWMKLVTNKIFIFFFVLMLTANGVYLVWILGNPTTLGWFTPADDYNAYAAGLSAYPDAEKYEITQRRIEENEEKLFAGEVSFELFDENSLYREFLDELKGTVKYSAMVSALVKNADSYKEDCKPGTYSYREYAKIGETYRNLIDVPVSYYPKRGPELLFHNPVFDCCNLFLLLVSVLLLTTAERQKGLSILGKSTKNGRLLHCVVKGAVTAGTSLVFLLLLFVENYLMIDSVYPFAPMSAAVQSLYPYCPYRVSIFGFTVLYLLLKYCFYLLCMAFFYLLCFGFRKTGIIFGALLAVAGLGAFLHTAVSDTSYLSFVNAVNPVRFSMTENFLSRLRLVNFFGMAADRTLLYVICWLLFALLFFLAGTFLYAEQEEKESVGRKVSLSVFFKYRGGVHAFSHECYKAFITQKLLLVLLLSAGLSWFLFVPETGKYYSVSDALYHKYSEQVEGKYDGKALAYSREKLDGIRDFIREDPSKKEDYQNVQRAYEQMERYAVYLSDKEGSYYVNNDGLVTLSGGNPVANRRYLVSLMVMFAVAAYCFVQLFEIDYEKGEVRLLKATPLGQKKYLLYKSIIGALTVLALMLLFLLPELISVGKVYGFRYLNVPAYSLTHLVRFGKNISVLGVISLKYFATALAMFFIYGLAYLVEKKAKNGMVSVIILCAVVEIPLLVMLVV